MGNGKDANRYIRHVIIAVIDFRDSKSLIQMAILDL